MNFEQIQTYQHIKNSIDHVKDQPGYLETIQDETYGLVHIRTVAIVDLHSIFLALGVSEASDFIDRIHPSSQEVGFYGCRAWSTPIDHTCSHIETHLVCSFLLESDNKEWTGEGGSYITKVKSKKDRKCPVAMSVKQYDKWSQLVKPYTIEEPYTQH